MYNLCFDEWLFFDSQSPVYSAILYLINQGLFLGTWKNIRWNQSRFYLFLVYKYKIQLFSGSKPKKNQGWKNMKKNLVWHLQDPFFLGCSDYQSSQKAYFQNSNIELWLFSKPKFGKSKPQITEKEKALLFQQIGLMYFKKG